MEHIRLFSDFLDTVINDDETHVQVRAYPQLPYGKKIVDEHGDYILIYYHQEWKCFVYTFKGAEDTYFSFHLIRSGSNFH